MKTKFVVLLLATLLATAPVKGTTTPYGSIDDKSEKINKQIENIPNSPDSGRASVSQATASVVDETLPIVMSQRNFSLPFNVATSPEKTPQSIQLLTSTDEGKNWMLSGTVSYPTSQREFFFRAAGDGEHWFILKSIYPDGTVTASPVQRILIRTTGASLEKVPDTAPSSNHSPLSNVPVKMGNLTDPPEPNEHLLRAQKLSQIASTLGEGEKVLNSNESAPSDLVHVSSEKPLSPEQEVQQAIPCGQIKTVSFGKTNLGEPTVMVRWFRPEDVGLAKESGGSLTLERATSPTGPWSTIATSLQSDQPGFWWKANQADVLPFYLRTVYTNDKKEQTFNVLPNEINLTAKLKGLTLDPAAPIVVAATAATKNDMTPLTPSTLPKEGHPSSKLGFSSLAESNTSLRTNGKSTDTPFLQTSFESESRKQQMETASTPSANSENGKETGKEINKTAFVPPQGQRYDAPQPSAIRGQQNGYRSNPGEMSINPLFTEGFGALFHSQRLRSQAVAATPSSPDPLTAREPAKKRSIFTPPTRNMVPPQQYQNGYNNANNGGNGNSGYSGNNNNGGYNGYNANNANNNQGYPNTLGNNPSGQYPNQPQMDNSEIIYLDQHGNRIANPFASGAVNGVPIVGQEGMEGTRGSSPYQGTIPYSQGDPYQGINGTSPQGAVIPYQDMSPYPQETTNYLPNNGYLQAGGFPQGTTPAPLNGTINAGLTSYQPPSTSTPSSKPIYPGPPTQ